MKKKHSASKAIIMAAGRGQRLYPMTLKVPKPLIEVRGQRMIDSCIEALRNQGIEEIYVVVGHLKEQFKELEELYPGLCLIENPYFDKCNNISSLFVAREHLGQCIIMDADQVINNVEVLNPNFDKSSYCCFWQEDDSTQEWILEVEEGDVTGCHRSGGRAGWQLQSVSFWSESDGQRLARDLEDIFIGEGKTQIYWDDVALNERPENYKLGIRRVIEGDIVEIDSLEELQSYDNTYLNEGCQ